MVVHMLSIAAAKGASCECLDEEFLKRNAEYLEGGRKSGHVKVMRLREHALRATSEQELMRATHASRGREHLESNPREK